MGTNYEKNPLILKGKTGIGKTHLLHGVQNELLRQNKDLKVIYVYAKDFMEEYLDFINNEKLCIFNQKYRNLDGLIVDNFEYFADRKAFQKELFYTLVSLLEKRIFVGIAITTPCNIRKKFIDELLSIFNHAVSINVPEPGSEAKHLLILSILAKNNCYFADDIINYLSNNNYDIPQLIGKMNKLLLIKDCMNKGFVKISKDEIENIIGEEKNE